MSDGIETLALGRFRSRALPSLSNADSLIIVGILIQALIYPSLQVRLGIRIYTRSIPEPRSVFPSMSGYHLHVSLEGDSSDLCYPEKCDIVDEFGTESVGIECGARRWEHAEQPEPGNMSCYWRIDVWVGFGHWDGRFGLVVLVVLSDRICSA